MAALTTRSGSGMIGGTVAISPERSGSMKCPLAAIRNIAAIPWANGRCQSLADLSGLLATKSLIAAETAVTARKTMNGTMEEIQSRQWIDSVTCGLTTV
mgnify:CR=1 FL=1